MSITKQWNREIAGRVQPNRTRLNIMSTLANDGWTPWGVKVPGHLALDDFADLDSAGRKGPPKIEYGLCRDYAFSTEEANLFVDAKLLTDGPPDILGRPTLVITEDGRRWLLDNWPHSDGD